MKKYILTFLIFIFISCSSIPIKKQVVPIGMAIIGMTIEMLIETYGEPTFRYSSRCADVFCPEYMIYGNNSIAIKDGIVVDVQTIH